MSFLACTNACAKRPKVWNWNCHMIFWQHKHISVVEDKEFMPYHVLLLWGMEEFFHLWAVVSPSAENVNYPQVTWKRLERFVYNHWYVKKSNTILKCLWFRENQLPRRHQIRTTTLLKIERTRRKCRLKVGVKYLLLYPSFQLEVWTIPWLHPANVTFKSKNCFMYQSGYNGVVLFLSLHMLPIIGQIHQRRNIPMVQHSSVERL